jgi:hypothetical protein
MEKNIIQILKAGNQELFYSSLFAWLLDDKGEHGLKNQFSDWLLKKIGLLNSEILTIDSEQKMGAIRADIYVVTKDGKKIIIENKTKSIGKIKQLNDYSKYADFVVPFAFVQENFSSIPPYLTTYSDILKCLKSCNIEDQKFTALTREFIEYIETILLPFETFHLFCNNQCTLDYLFSSLTPYFEVVENHNDIRFFQYVYFLRLRNFIIQNVPSLNFGSIETYYNSKKHEFKPSATSWIIEKNMQGPAFMESIIYKQEITNKLKVLEKWEAIFNDDDTKSLDISPRIELWIEAKKLTSQKNAGIFQIGTWDSNLLNAFNSSKIFFKRGSRNFHQRILSLEDLKYKNITNIMIEEMKQIWNFL